MTDAYIRAYPDRFIASLEIAKPSIITPRPEPQKRDHRSPEIARQNLAVIRGLAGGVR